MTLLQELDYDIWKKEIATRIAEHVQANFRHYYPALASVQNARIAVEQPPHRRRFTVIFEIGIRNGKGPLIKSLIAKAYRITPKKNARDQDVDYKSRKEFLVHRQIYEYFSTQAAEFSVVRPLDYVPELRALIIEKAEGLDLGTLIHQARYSVAGYSGLKKELGETMQRCGKWLALLHQGFGAPALGYLDAAHLEHQVNRYYQRLLRAGGSAKVADPIRQRILTRVQSFIGEPIKFGRLHGDFKLRHIFVTDHRIMPIDFGNTLEGATYDDVARLLVEIKLLDYGPQLPGRRDLMRYLQDHFLIGYFGSAEWPPLLRLYYLIWLWAKWDRRFKKFATNKVVKKVDGWMRYVGLKHLLNSFYVNEWFESLLNTELDFLEREIEVMKGS